MFHYSRNKSQKSNKERQQKKTLTNTWQSYLKKKIRVNMMIVKITHHITNLLRKETIIQEIDVLFCFHWTFVMINWNSFGLMELRYFFFRFHHLRFSLFCCGGFLCMTINWKWNLFFIYESVWGLWHKVKQMIVGTRAEWYKTLYRCDHSAE